MRKARFSESQIIKVLKEVEGGRTVVEDVTILAEHESIAALAGLEALPAIDVDPLEEFGGVGTPHLDFSERRDIHHPYASTNRTGLLVYALHH